MKSIGTSPLRMLARSVIDAGTPRVRIPISSHPLVWLKGPNISDTIKRDYISGFHFDIVDPESGQLDWDAPLDWDATLVWTATYWVGTYSAPAAEAVLITADSGINFLYDTGGIPVVRSQEELLALNNNRQYFSVRRGFIAFPIALDAADDLKMKAWL